MWHVIVPVKEWETAKSRLDLRPLHRQEIAKAMAHDTVESLVGCPLVRSVSVVTTTPSMIGSAELRAASQMLVQPDRISTLDEALSWAIEQSSDLASALAGEAAGELVRGTAVVVADLPAATDRDFERLLSAASHHKASMVVDRHGTGTTVLAATDPRLLDPRFGTRSASRHRNRDVTVLTDDACAHGVRCDVDTLADLAAARVVGLGRHSRFVDAQLGSPA
jgi:2-phospho-L-lactate guanylyltransferase